MRTINRTIVAANIWSSDAKIFMALDNPKHGGVYSGCWKIPGGGLEEGESLIEGVIRETKEEIGLDISTFPIELIDDTMTGESEKTLKDTGERVIVKMRFYEYKIVLDKPADEILINLDNKEFAEYKWFTVPELKTIKLSPPSIEILTKLGLL